MLWVKISFCYFLNFPCFVLEEVAMVYWDGNMENNYYDLQMLNCVEYKDNRKGTETNGRWASKAAFFVL